MKKQITLRIDEGLLSWFKSRGKGYQSEIHKALEKYRSCDDGCKTWGQEAEETADLILPRTACCCSLKKVTNTVADELPNKIPNAKPQFRSYSKAEQLGKKK